MRDIAEFSSSSFRPFLPEESQVNGEVYGAELAFWLARKLSEAGVVTSYPASEDWGWYLEYESPSETSFMILCRNTDEEGEAWNLAIDAIGQGFFGKKKPADEDASAAIEAIRRTLDEASEISNVSWMY